METIANDQICQILQLKFQYHLYYRYILSDNFCSFSLIPFLVMAAAQHSQLLHFSLSQGHMF